MPNLDGGHYFLTVLAPVRTDTKVDPDNGSSRSHRHLLAEKLALLPTGRQTAASPANDHRSPLAGNTLNHFARFVTIDRPAFNGRNSQNTLVSLLRGINPLTSQPADQLGTPYLLFAADIDANGDGKAALRAYTDMLWQTMKHDLLAIFGHCIGFDRIETADAFHDYVKRCQIETTMPFNDYWANGLKVDGAKLPIGTIKVMAGAVLGAALIWAVILIIHGLLVLLGVEGKLTNEVASAAALGAIVVPTILALAGLILYASYNWVLKKGAQSLPTAPDSDLPSILKALFLQQHFTRFAIESQGTDDAALYRGFGKFLDVVQPAQAEPRQGAGEVYAPTAEWSK